MKKTFSFLILLVSSLNLISQVDCSKIYIVNTANEVKPYEPVTNTLGATTFITPFNTSSLGLDPLNKKFVIIANTPNANADVYVYDPATSTGVTYPGLAPNPGANVYNRLTFSPARSIAYLFNLQNNVFTKLDFSTSTPVATSLSAVGAPPTSGNDYIGGDIVMRTRTLGYLLTSGFATGKKYFYSFTISGSVLTFSLLGNTTTTGAASSLALDPAGSGTLYFNSGLNIYKFPSTSTGTFVATLHQSSATTLAFTDFASAEPPTVAAASPDQTVCNAAPIFTVSGNLPSKGFGSWSYVSGTGSFTGNPDDAVTTVSVAPGNTLTIKYGIKNCSETVDNVVIKNSGLPSTASAGTNTTICFNNYVMSANAPTMGTGAWTKISGGSTIVSINSPTTIVTGLTLGANVFKWEISSGTCPSSSSTVTITYTNCPPSTDHDGDGIPNTTDVDDDNDGILDTAEGTGDTDGDGIPNNLDLDSDNDGIFDIIEAGGSDIDNDGIAGSSPVSVAPNGLPTSLGGTPTSNLDTDGDGAPNSLDLDSDNDGIFDVVENGNTSLDTDNNGILNGVDTDGDGILNLAGIDTNSILGGTGSAPKNFDGDTKPNFIDLDSDNDGIVDVRESGNGTLDANNNGVVDGTDTDGDGIINVVTIDPNATFGGLSVTPLNTDANTGPDYLDIDADNDGIVDNIEGQTTTGYTPPSITDTDGDGIDNTYDGVVGFGGPGIIPTNTDATDKPDYLDLDSDNDGNADSIEGWDLNGDDIIGVGEISASGADVDADGLDDAFDNDDTSVNPTNGQVPTSFPNVEGGTIQPDWRDSEYVDHDGDGVPDITDIDDDNDGVLDTVEGTGDADGDGVPNYFDLDSDNDGIFEVVENGASDQNNDGIVGNSPITVDANGLPTVLGGFPISNIDTDGDGVPNSLDLDADNDGIFDVVENETATLDANNDGVMDGTDTDGDGIVNVLGVDNNSTIGGTGKTPANFDGDTKPNFIDLDSDGDGIVDVIESGNGTLDTDNDGIVDGTDTDSDGIINVFLIDPNPTFGGTSIVLSNADNTGKPDYLDIDADNDGIVDNIEGQSTSGYITPTGSDTDGDGIDNAYDAALGFGGAGITPVNTDGTDNADFTDLDSDNDGNADSIEGWDLNGDDIIGSGEISSVGIDTDSDGLDNAFDNNDSAVNPTNGQTTSSFPNVEGGTSQPDWRDVEYDDNDGDGVPDITDIDDDNDGILDVTEGASDFDGDGIPNLFDLDSDNDGISDVLEGGSPDTNNDGLADNFSDFNNDGLDDTVAGNSGFSGTSVPDTDSDGSPDFLDLDSDSDGLLDVTEGGSPDTNSDGLVDNFTDLNGNGWDDTVESSIGFEGPAVPDTDGDGVPDYQQPLDLSISVPEGFSPNGDGVNDVLVIKGISKYPESELTILNRWGNNVFTVKGYDNSWNGKATEGLRYGSDELPEGTYFYILDLKNGDKPLKGYIYLNRAVK